MTEILLLPLRRLLWGGILTTAMLLAVCPAGATQGPEGIEAVRPDASCGEAITRLQEQNRELSASLRRIHREVAALRQELATPGMEEAFSGIGYILGLFGVAFFFLGARKRKGE